MDAIAKSGLTLPNRLARITLETIEEVLTPNGMISLLNLAHLGHLHGNYPPATLERGYDFAEFSALNVGLEEMYGPRGGRGLALRVGRTLFSRMLSNFGALAGVEAMAFKILPPGRKLKVGLLAMARIFSETCDMQASLEETGPEFHFVVARNPVCWGRAGEDKPVCFMMVGILEEALARISGGHEFRVVESLCFAAGAHACRFVIQKEPIS